MIRGACIAGWRRWSCDNAPREAEVYLRLYSELIQKSIEGEHGHMRTAKNTRVKEYQTHQV